MNILLAKKEENILNWKKTSMAGNSESKTQILVAA